MSRYDRYSRYDSYGWRPYVPVGKRLTTAAAHAAKLAKKQGREVSPVKLEGKKIATTFWGKAWCDNLSSYSDYANRLPRGATYVRNGSVVDLVISSGTIEAIVAGSETYTIKIQIAPLPKSTWNAIKQDCSASIESLLDLLAGRFSDGVMKRLTNQKDGLFPSPREIKMECSCPDFSDCCKHLAAVMYGIGARLDKQPELLFVLRDVDHRDLVSQAVAEGNLDRQLTSEVEGSLADEDLESIFGIELDRTAEVRKKPVTATADRPTKVKRAAKTKKPSAITKKASQKSKRKLTSSPPGNLSKKTASTADGAVAHQLKVKKSATIRKTAVRQTAVKVKKSVKLVETRGSAPKAGRSSSRRTA